MKKKIFFLDVISINKNNISTFLETEDWPVPEPLFRSLTNFIFEEYTEKILKFKGKSYKLAVIELSFLSILINALHYNYVKNFCIKNNYKYIYHKSTNKFLNPNWDEISKTYENYNYPYNKLQRFLRKIIKLVYFNLHLNFKDIVKGFFSVRENISLGSFDNIKKDYIKKSKKFFVHIEWVDLIKKSNLNKKIYKQNGLNNNIIKKILIKIANKPSFKPFIKSLDFDKINLAYNHRVSSLSLIYDNLLTLKTPKEIIFTESPKAYHKIISSVFLDKGAKVINFTHGNNIGLVHQKWTQTYFYAQSGNYGFESYNTCKAIKKIAKNLPLASKESTNFFSVNSEIGLKRKNIIYKKIKKDSIKKVMFMGYPMNITRYTGDVYCFFHYKLKLQINILKKLKKLGYYTIYKAHPDRLMEIGSLMNGYADECDNNKFENVWNKADALIFTYCTTTTFGFAITTPLPIVLLNETTTDWDHQKKLQIQKRIHILNYKYSNTNYREISSLNLNKGLKMAQNKIAIDQIKQI